MAVSVTVPASTTDAQHLRHRFRVHVRGGDDNIVIPPTLVTLQMKDTNANGKVDQVVATFDDTLAPYSAGVSSWALANVPSAGSLASVTVNGAGATLTLAEGAGAAYTAVGTFTIGLSPNSAGIRDIYDHLASFAPTAPTDLAAPAPLSLTMKDSNANGRIDQVTMTFSDALATYLAPTTVWTLENVPSAGSLASVAVATPSVTLTIAEGAGAVDTTRW